MLVVKGEQKFLFKTSTSEERDKWVESITKVMHNLDRLKDSDTLSRASLRSSFRRNAVTITRSSSLSPTPVVVSNGTNSPRGSPQTSPRNSPIRFLDNPAHILRSDSFPFNATHKRSPIIVKKNQIPSGGSPTMEMENNNNTHFIPIQRTVSLLSTSSHGSTSSYNSSIGPAPAIDNHSVTHSSKPTNQDPSDDTSGNQRVSNI